MITTNTHKASWSTYIIEHDQRNLLHTNVNEDKKMYLKKKTEVKKTKPKIKSFSFICRRQTFKDEKTKLP